MLIPWSRYTNDPLRSLKASPQNFATGQFHDAMNGGLPWDPMACGMNIWWDDIQVFIYFCYVKSGTNKQVSIDWLVDSRAGSEFFRVSCPPHGFKWITHPLATSKQWSLEGHPLTRLACRRFRYTWQSNRDMDFGPACDGYTDVLSIKNGDFQTSILEY